MNTSTQNQNKTRELAKKANSANVARLASGKSPEQYMKEEEDRKGQLTFAYCLGFNSECDGSEHYERGGEDYETLEELYDDLHEQLLGNEVKKVFKISIWVQKDEMKEESNIEYKKVRSRCFQNQSWCGKFDMIAVEKEREGVCVPPELEEAEEKLETIRRRSEEAEEQLRLGMEEAMVDAFSGSDLSEEEVAFQDIQ